MVDPIRITSMVPAASIDRTLRPAGKVSQSDPTSALGKACQDFESIFINQMMQQMRQTVPQDGLFNGGQAEQIYTSMLDSEMANSIAEQRGLGLAQVLYRQLSELEDKKPIEGKITEEPKNQITK